MLPRLNYIDTGVCLAGHWNSLCREGCEQGRERDMSCFLSTVGDSEGALALVFVEIFEFFGVPVEMGVSIIN